MFWICLVESFSARYDPVISWKLVQFPLGSLGREVYVVLLKQVTSIYPVPSLSFSLPSYLLKMTRGKFRTFVSEMCYL